MDTRLAITAFKRCSRSGYWPNPVPGLCTSHDGRYWNIISRVLNFNIHLNCFHTFGVRGPLHALDLENQPGSGSGLDLPGSGPVIWFWIIDGKSYIKSMNAKKKPCKIIWKIHSKAFWISLTEQDLVPRIRIRIRNNDVKAHLHGIRIWWRGG